MVQQLFEIEFIGGPYDGSKQPGVTPLDERPADVVWFVGSMARTADLPDRSRASRFTNFKAKTVSGDTGLRVPLQPTNSRN